MKNSSLMILSLAAIIFLLNSCSIIGGIFKAGMGLGIFIVVVIIMLIVIIVLKVKARK